jgi:hypothetical protein
VVLALRAAESPNGGKICGKRALDFLPLTHSKSMSQIKVNSINACGFITVPNAC